MVSNLCRSITQRVYLKTTPLDFRYDFRFRAEIPHDFNVLARDDKRGQFVIDGRVLNQRAMSVECCLELSQGKKILLVSCLTVATAMLKLAGDFQQLLFTLKELVFQSRITVLILHCTAHRA